MNNTTMIPPYTQRSFSSMKLRLWDWLRRFIIGSPHAFELNIVIKDPFFLTCNDILEKRVIFSDLKKKRLVTLVCDICSLRV